MINIAITFSFSIVGIFTLYRQIFIFDVKLTVAVFLLQLAWIGYYFFIIVGTIQVASATTKEVRSSVNKLYSYLMSGLIISLEISI